MMRLKEIELQGFKSFADRTRVPLPADILVVVGPNGAGKSNVTDAVLWALGEQNARFLRGKKMVDVIFNGTPKRPPAGSAQVLMTFEDGEGTKIQVGRRLLRSGDSSYLMDGRPVRLKDVQDFLMRHSISTQGTYLVEQGEVAALLKANPEERRMIFEEAAGIAHFKENRRSALSKLEGTQANLTRLNDIVAEVETQMASLKRQASKAERFARLSDELRERRRVFWGRNFGRLTGQKSAFSRDLALLLDERQRRETALVRLQAEQEQASVRLSEHEASLAALIQAIHQKELDNTRGEAEIKRRTELVAQNQGRIRQIAADREELRRRIEAGRKDVEALKETAKAHEAAEAAAAAESEAASTRLDDARARLAALEEEQRVLRQSAFTQAQEQARLSSEIKRMEEDLRRLAERQKRLDREGEGLDAREQGLRETLEAKVAERLAADGVLAEARRSREAAEERALACQRAAEAASSALAEARQNLAASQSRLAVLTQQDAALRSSAHAFLKKRDARHVKKSLAEVLAGVPKEFVPALSAALGDLLEGYLDGEWKDLTADLSALRSEKAGEAVFFLAVSSERQRTVPDIKGQRGFVGWLHDVKGVSESVRPCLPLVSLASDAEAARDMARQSGIPSVSMDGIFVHPEGWVRGGTGGKGGSTLLEHERERLAADASHKSALAAAGEREESLKGAQLALEVAQGALEISRQDEARLQQEATARAREVEDLESERGRLEGSRELHETEVAQAREEKAAWEPELKSLTKDHHGAAGEAARIEARTKAVEASLAQAREAQNQAHESVAAARSAWTEVNERLQAGRATVQRSERSIADLESTEARQARDAEGLAARVATLTAEITDGGRALKDLLLSLEDLRRRKVTFEEELRRLQDEVQHGLVQVKDARETLDQSREEVNRHEVTLAGIEADLRNLTERMGEFFEEPPEQLAAGFADAEPLTDEERETEQRALARLEERVKELGAVNMLAREEFAEHAKRFEFLSGQRKDVEEAVAQLQETIRDINATTRDRFMEAFEAVRGHFGRLFKEVFEGGEARLTLQDEQNPLDTGVEIFAQPPGKRLQHMEQLSGGEKAMVAIALLFSLFRYRPQPFFILDEVDAPLDEANVQCFARLLAQFRGQTQFIVVTHNKKTMEIAEVLFGVTMPEGGISRIVSVRLEDVEKELAAGQGA